MKIQRVAIGITIVNLVLTTLLLAQFRSVNAKQQQAFVEPVLRGRALEIVDSLGRKRASITIQPPVVVDGKLYPETPLLRLINEDGKPVVKIAASKDGSGLTLVNANDEGVIISVHDSGSKFKIYHKGKEKVLEP